MRTRPDGFFREDFQVKQSVRTAFLLTFAMLLLTGLSAAQSGRRAPTPFSNTSLSGPYAVSFHGVNSGGDTTVTGESLAPLNGVGLLNADGNGHFTGTQTANIMYNTNGVPTASANCPSGASACDAICTTTLTGTYTINPDGTGTTTATATPAANSDPRCGPSSGFTTTSSIVMSSPNHLVFVGTDFDSTIGGTADSVSNTTSRSRRHR
jgi:hypothetical protein